MKKIIEQSFIDYAGAVLQSRALTDARDVLKPSARQIFYCMYTDKFVHSKPFKKTLKAIGSAMRMYIHGDSSCEGIIMRAAQPFAMRYPLVEVEGSYGNLMDSGNWAAPRYTSARLSALAEYLFTDIGKDTIEEWRNNYDDTETYPMVMPSKGFFNLVNGTSGIGIGAASSIPQFNLKELNVALMRLLVNPNTPFEDIVCLPDFATGGILLNAAEVKESLRKGTGAACKLRSVINYDAKENCLVVTEIPYSVYTNTICGQLEKIMQSEDNPGIDRFNDLTGATPLIKIYLVKGANVPAVIQYLYKETSLQYYYGINMTMLENGRFPRVYGFKELLLAHLEHEREVYRRGFIYDLNKMEFRIHIIDALLVAIADIDNVIAIIKASKNKDEARKNLIAKYEFDIEQTNAILDMKLSRLSNLETVDLQTEKGELQKKVENISAILAEPKLLNDEIEKGLREVMNKFGDARRTQILNVDTASDSGSADEIAAATKPEEFLYVVIDGNSILPIQPEAKINLGKKGSMFAKNVPTFGYVAQNTDVVYLFDKAGLMYRVDNRTLAPGTLNPFNAQFVCALTDMSKEFVITVSRNGIVKKTLASEYAKVTRATAVCKLRADDELVYVGCGNNDDYLLLLGAAGGVVKVQLSSFNSTGKLTIGVKGIADTVVGAAIGADKDLVFTCATGKGKLTPVNDFVTTAKGGKGQVVADQTNVLCQFRKTMYVIEGSKLTRYTTSNLSTKGKTAQGAKVCENLSIKIAN